MPAILEDPNVGHLFPTPSRNRPIWPSRDEFEVRWSHGLVEEQRMKNGLSPTKSDLTESPLRAFQYEVDTKKLPPDLQDFKSTLRGLEAWGLLRAVS